MSSIPAKNSPQERPKASAKTNKGKRYRFEFSSLQLAGFGLGSLVVMVWLFVFGVLVGRDLPVPGGEEMTLRGQLVRFLDLPHEPVKPATEQAAETWEDPNKVLEELDYQKALTEKSGVATEASPPKAETSSNRPAATKPGGDAAARTQHKPAATADRPAARKEDPAPAAATAGNEQHALMVASFRSQENAQKLMQTLRSKGYDPQLDSQDKPDGTRWFRIVVGSFKSREEAQRFAAEFNKREKLQGMVVRLSP
jgi:cell division septation protein DedD